MSDSSFKSNLFTPVSSLPSFPDQEASVLTHWKATNAFQRSIDERPQDKSFTFYDGPPFATGLPHYGHILTSVLKDVIPRYKTMQGYRVERRWGWDCHGLPIENIIEKELGLNSKQEIEAYGVDTFNEACRATVLKYAKEWEVFIDRIGRWVDFENDYKTMDRDYMESVWWAFKQLVEKGLVYESFKVLWYCTRCATPLSNFEAGLDDAYRKRQDPSLTFKVAVQADSAGGRENVWLWLWTTTPWTIPSHAAVAVGEAVDYVLLRHPETGEGAVIAKARAEDYTEELKGWQQEEELKGSDLVGWMYAPPFDLFASRRADGAFRVVAADFVTDTDGTGLAHEAPAFGMEDFALAQEVGIPFDIKPINASGEFTNEVPAYAGQHVHAASPQIIKDLKALGSVVRHATHDHSYPHCWRCDEPLIQTAVETWFVEVTKVRDRMVELNQNIHWVPDRVKDGIFGNWLAGARDWAVSRNRYWGAPIPVWKCDGDCNEALVIGSVEELAARTDADVSDIHKHYVDPITFPCESSDCDGVMRRVPEVFDCWFESGSMPYAQQHYPFENTEAFEQSFPGDFITEYVGQTRGWFYTMTVLATALFDAEPFKNVIVHGIVLAEDGRKMSKRLKNYPDPTELVNKYGADPLRLYLMSSSVIRGDDMRFSEQELVELMRRTLMTIWNVYSFFLTYASVDGFEPQEHPPAPKALLDRWVLSRLQSFTREATDALESYEVQRYVRALEAFVEELSNWYVRRSRRRFWKSEDDADKLAAEQTLYTVLHQMSLVMAPVLPFLAETLYQGLTRGNAKDSVHLESWPEASDALVAETEEVSMKRLRDYVTLGHSARDAAGIKVRQPLAELCVRGDALADEYVDMLKEELNVKHIAFVDSLDALVRVQAALDFAKAGPVLQGDVGKVKVALENGDWERTDDGYVVAGHVLTSDLVSLGVVAQDERWSVAGDARLHVALDTQLTEALRLEGLARDAIRAIQQLRKEADYAVSDRIQVVFSAVDAESLDVIQSVLASQQALLEREVLATHVEVGSQLPDAVDASSVWSMEACEVHIGVMRADA